MLAAYTSRVKPSQDEFSHTIPRSNSESSLQSLKARESAKKLTLSDGKGSLLDGLGLETSNAQATAAAEDDDEKAKSKAKRLALIARSKARREIKLQEQKEKEEKEKKKAESKKVEKPNAFPLDLARDANKGRGVDRSRSGGYALERLAQSSSLLKSSGHVAKTRTQQALSLHASRTLHSHPHPETEKHVGKSFAKSDHVRVVGRGSSDLDSEKERRKAGGTGKLEEAARVGRGSNGETDGERVADRKKQKLQELRAIRKERRAEEENNKSPNDVESEKAKDSDEKPAGRGRPKRGVERSKTGGAKLDAMRGRAARPTQRPDVRTRAKSTNARRKNSKSELDSPLEEMELSLSDLASPVDEKPDRYGNLGKSCVIGGRARERREQLMKKRPSRSEHGPTRSEHDASNRARRTNVPPKGGPSSNARRLASSPKRKPERNEALGKSVAVLSYEDLEDESDHKSASRSSSDAALPPRSFDKRREKSKGSARSKSPFRKSERNEAMGKSFAVLSTENFEESHQNRKSSDMRSNEKQKYSRSKEKSSKNTPHQSKSPLRPRRDETLGKSHGVLSTDLFEDSDHKSSSRRSSSKAMLPASDEKQKKERSKEKSSKSTASNHSRSPPRQPARNEALAKDHASFSDLEEYKSSTRRSSSEGRLPNSDERQKKERPREKSSKSSHHSRSPGRRPERNETLGKSHGVLTSESFEGSDHKSSDRRCSSDATLPSSHDKHKKDRKEKSARSGPSSSSRSPTRGGKSQSELPADLFEGSDHKSTGRRVASDTFLPETSRSSDKQRKDPSKDSSGDYRSKSSHQRKAGGLTHKKRLGDDLLENRDEASPKGSSEKAKKTGRGGKTGDRRADMRRSLSQAGILSAGSDGPGNRKLHRSHSDESFMDTRISSHDRGEHPKPKRTNSSGKLTRKEKSGSNSRKDDKAKAVPKRPAMQRSSSQKGILGNALNGSKRPELERSHSEQSFMEFAKKGKSPDKQKTKSSNAAGKSAPNSRKDEISKSENRRAGLRKSFSQKSYSSDGSKSENKRGSLSRSGSQKALSASSHGPKSFSQRPSLEKMRSHSERSFRMMQSKNDDDQEAHHVKHGKEAVRSIPRRNRSAGQELERAAKEAVAAAAKERKAKKSKQRG